VASGEATRGHGVGRWSCGVGVTRVDGIALPRLMRWLLPARALASVAASRALDTGARLWREPVRVRCKCWGGGSHRLQRLGRGRACEACAARVRRPLPTKVGLSTAPRLVECPTPRQPARTAATVAASVERRARVSGYVACPSDLTVGPVEAGRVSTALLDRSRRCRVPSRRQRRSWGAGRGPARCRRQKRTEACAA